MPIPCPVGVHAQSAAYQRDGRSPGPSAQDRSSAERRRRPVEAIAGHQMSGAAARAEKRGQGCAEEPANRTAGGKWAAEIAATGPAIKCLQPIEPNGNEVNLGNEFVSSSSGEASTGKAITTKEALAVAANCQESRDRILPLFEAEKIDKMKTNRRRSISVLFLLSRWQLARPA